MQSEGRAWKTLASAQSCCSASGGWRSATFFFWALFSGLAARFSNTCGSLPALSSQPPITMPSSSCFFLSVFHSLSPVLARQSLARIVHGVGLRLSVNWTRSAGAISRRGQGSWMKGGFGIWRPHQCFLRDWLSWTWGLRNTQWCEGMPWRWSCGWDH